jgi:hypothetical protein
LIPPKSLAELDKRNQENKDAIIGVSKGVANLFIAGENSFLSMNESTNSPIPLLQPSNETQALFMGVGTVLGTVASANPIVIGESTPATLTRIAGEAVETVGPGKGGAYGTQVHKAFEEGVNKLGKPNLSTEVSYRNGSEVPRGTSGSIRVDVAEGPRNAPTSVYDLKTGSATLTSSRIQQIQQHVPKLPNGNSVPVVEIRPPHP